MAKLTKAQAKAHAQAIDLLSKDRLSDDECEFVFDNWQESAEHINTIAGAFFTPRELAEGFAYDAACPGRIIDLCAGIGMLSYAVQCHAGWWAERPEITCVEANPAYVEVGRKLVPDANWICADILDVLDMDLGRFAMAISNPPFGSIKRAKGKRAPRYKGSAFEFHVIDIAAHLADFGAFILPAMSTGIKRPGESLGNGWHLGFRRDPDCDAARFQTLTDLRFEPSNVDPEPYRRQWRGVAPNVEIITVDFLAREEATATADPTIPAQLDMFARAA